MPGQEAQYNDPWCPVVAIIKASVVIGSYWASHWIEILFSIVMRWFYKNMNYARTDILFKFGLQIGRCPTWSSRCIMSHHNIVSFCTVKMQNLAKLYPRYWRHFTSPTYVSKTRYVLNVTPSWLCDCDTKAVVSDEILCALGELSWRC